MKNQNKKKDDSFYVINEDVFEDEPLPSHQRMQKSEEFLIKFGSVDFRTGELGSCGTPVGSNGEKVYVCSKPYHVAIEAATGKGKSRSITIPCAELCCNSGESVVYVTTKSGDIGQLYDFAKERGVGPVVLDFSNPEYSDSIDIMSFLKEARCSADPWERLNGEVLASRIANIAIDPSRFTTNVEWVLGTMMVCTGLLLFGVDKLPGSACNTLALAQVLEELISDDDNPVKDAVCEDPKYRDLFSPILLSSAHVTKEGYKSVFYSTVMSSLCNPVYAPVLNKADADFTHLDERPGMVIMVVSEGDYSSMITASVVLTIMHMAMVNRIESSATARSATKVNFIIDEFGSLFLPQIGDWLSQGRARGFSYTLAYQSEGQIIEKYGAGLTESILSNCRLKIFMGSQNSKVIDKYVSQLGTSDGPLISADQLRKMSGGQALILCDGMDPYFGRMIDFSTVVQLYPLKREKREFHAVRIPDLSKWHDGCEESELFIREDGSPSIEDLSASSAIDALRALHAYGEEGIIHRLQASTDSREDFHELMDKCLSEFDFSNGVGNLETHMCFEMLGKVDTSEEIREFVRSNKQFASDYPDVIAEKIEKAFRLLRTLDDDDIIRLKTTIDSDEDDDSEPATGRTPGDSGDALRIEAPFDDPEVDTINGCLGDLTVEDVDVDELSYDILEALVRRHKSKEEIISHRQEYEAIIDLFRQPVIEAFKSAMHKIDILSEAQVKEIRRIIES